MPSCLLPLLSTSKFRLLPFNFLREYFDHDSPILGAAFLRGVRRDRLLVGVADDVHLVQRDLVLLVQIALRRFGALETDPLVDFLGTDVVGVPFDLDKDVLRILLELLHDPVELLLDLVGQARLTELEVAVLRVQDHLVHQAAVRPPARPRGL